MPAPLPVASPPDDGIVVEFTVGDVTLAPCAGGVKLRFEDRVYQFSVLEFERLIAGGIRYGR